MGDVDVKRLRELRAAATGGTWVMSNHRGSVYLWRKHPQAMIADGGGAAEPSNEDVILRMRGVGYRLPIEANAELIVAAINALPDLLDRIEALEAARDSARASAIEEVRTWERKAMLARGIGREESARIAWSHLRGKVSDFKLAAVCAMMSGAYDDDDTLRAEVMSALDLIDERDALRERVAELEARLAPKEGDER